MSVKKVFMVLVVLVGVAAFLALSVNSAQAYRPEPNSPPLCYPSFNAGEGYWGVDCLDLDNNIAFAGVKTEGNIIYLYWDESVAHIIVEADQNTYIKWQVCDKLMACTGGVHP